MKKGRKGSSYNIIIPSRVRKEVRKYTYSNGTQAAINLFKSKYPKYISLRTSINNRKHKLKNQKEDLLPPIFTKCRRPNIVRDDLLQKIKKVVVEVRLSGAVISRKMVVSIGNMS